MLSNTTTVADIRIFLLKELDGRYPVPEIDAFSYIIIKHLTGLEKKHLLSDPSYIIGTEDWLKVKQICHELKENKPLQYILGETEFFGHRFKVNPSVLIPRQETEELVDLVISENNENNNKIIDIGTGSGCIAICLKAALPGSLVHACDISDDALDCAISNAEINNTDIHFFRDDIRKPSAHLYGIYSIIVSNPPYVTTAEKALMEPNVLDYEPYSALFVDDDSALEYYDAILKHARTILIPGGKVYFEINENKHYEMTSLLEAYGYRKITILRDINGKYRLLKATRNGG